MLYYDLYGGYNMREDFERLLKEYDASTFGNKKIIKSMEELVKDDEIVIFIYPTNLKIRNVNYRKKEKLPGVALLTDKRFMFKYKVGFESSLEVINLEHIENVNIARNALLASSIQLNSLTKTYELLISHKKGLVDKIGQTFEKAINDCKFKQEQQTVITSSADEILKFKKLLDEGIITKEEFEIKKKQLLNL